MRVGIFGGTFNPPHLGHLHIAKQFASHYTLDELLIIPTYTPPHKDAPSLATGEDRLELCRRTFTDPFFTVSAVEIERGGKSYTVDTLHTLHAQYPAGTEFYFLVGDDMLLFLEHWYHSHEILSLCTVVSSVRSNTVSLATLETYAKTHYPEEYEKGAFRFMPMEALPLSSTEVREKLQRGEATDKLLTPEALAYIQQKGLYV